MNRRSLLKFLLSAPAAAAVGLGTLIGKRKAASFRVADSPNWRSMEYKPVSDEEERRIFAAFDELLDNTKLDTLR